MNRKQSLNRVLALYGHDSRSRFADSWNPVQKPFTKIGHQARQVCPRWEKIRLCSHLSLSLQSRCCPKSLLPWKDGFPGLGSGDWLPPGCIRAFSRLSRQASPAVLLRERCNNDSASRNCCQAGIQARTDPRRKRPGETSPRERHDASESRLESRE